MDALEAEEMNEQWVTWALQGLIAFVLGKLWGQLDTVTKDLAELKTQIAGDTISKVDWKEMRDRMHTVEGYIAGRREIEKAQREGTLEEYRRDLVAREMKGRE